MMLLSFFLPGFNFPSSLLACNLFWRALLAWRDRSGGGAIETLSSHPPLSSLHPMHRAQATDCSFFPRASHRGGRGFDHFIH